MADRLSRRLTLVGGVLSLAGLVTACASEGFLTWEPETPAERELRKRAEALQSTVGEGGLSGALVGALIGLATGNPGAVFAGARAGRLAGAGAGLYVRALQSDFAEREAQLAQISTDLQVTIADVEAALDTMRTVRDEQLASIAALRDDVAAQAASAEALSRQQERATRALAEMRRAIDGAGRREAIFAETRGLVLADPAEGPGSATEADLERYLSVLSQRLVAMRSVADSLEGAL